MDAEIRRLTYIPRVAGANNGIGTLPVGSFFGQLPPLLRKEDLFKQDAKMSDVRSETRLIELERERRESERRHHEALAAAQERAAEELAIALSEQRERLEHEHASTISVAISTFQEAQREYFAEAEAAVVRLALSIAGRVLHREAQMDPLLLRGAVRVALEDAQRGTCVLEVSADRAEAWGRWLSEMGAQARVQIRAKDDVAPGHCRVEIGPSAADLSVNTQLAEIERGFFDLLQNRPSPVESEPKQER